MKIEIITTSNKSILKSLRVLKYKARVRITKNIPNLEKAV